MAVENVWGLVAVLTFYVTMLVIGIVAGRKQLRRNAQSDTTETMLAGRNIGMVVGILTMTATWVGGGYINGTAEAIYLAVNRQGGGLVWAQAPVAYSIALAIGGIFFAKKMREAEYMTMIDPLQEKLGDWMGAVLVLPAICGEIFWSASILGALGSTLAVIIGLELWVSVLISACVALLYVVIGGLASVVYTDVIQLFCIAAGLIVAIPYALKNPAVGEVFIPPANASSVEWIGYVRGKDWGLFIDAFLQMTFGGIPWQAYFQRVLAARTPRGAQVLSIAGSVGCLLMAIPPVIFGGIGFATDWNQTAYAGVDRETGKVDPRYIVPLVLQYLTPPVVAVIGLGAVSAAVMSSADSSMLSCSTLFAQNVYKAVFRPTAGAREVVWVLRGAAVVFCSIATALAIKVKTVYGLLVICGDFVYVLLFPQLACTFYVPWFNTFGSACGFIVSLILRVIGGENYMNWPASVGYPGYDAETNTQYFPYKTLSMVCGLMVMLAVSYLTDWLMVNGRMDVKWLRLVNNRFDRLPVKTDDEDSETRQSIDEEMVEVKKDLMNNELS